MQIINKKRGHGKTVGLIFASEATGYPIITFDPQRASNIIQMAAAYGCEIPDPLVFERGSGGYFEHEIRRNEKAFVDDLECFLPLMLKDFFKIEIAATTMTVEMRQRKVPKEDEPPKAGKEVQHEIS